MIVEVIIAEQEDKTHKIKPGDLTINGWKYLDKDMMKKIIAKLMQEGGI